MNEELRYQAGYWTPDELANVLRVKAGVVRAMCRAGKIGAKRVGPRLWRIPWSEIKKEYPELAMTPLSGYAFTLE
jgi:excisionase family DNA binding protein